MNASFFLSDHEFDREKGYTVTILWVYKNEIFIGIQVMCTQLPWRSKKSHNVRTIVQHVEMKMLRELLVL